MQSACNLPRKEKGLCCIIQILTHSSPFVLRESRDAHGIGHAQLCHPIEDGTFHTASVR